MITLFTPRKHQQEIFDRLQRFNVLVNHRRFGKTVFCINTLIRSALLNEKDNPRYAYIAPLFRQAKQVAWDYLKEYTKAIPGTRYYENELRVDLPNGARIQLFGADNPDALRGIYLDGVVLDEFAQMKPGLWGSVIRPLLTDRLGFAIFIGTPQGHNEFYDLYQYALSDPAWFACMYKASQTGIIPEEELEQARREMEPEEYDQEFECSFEAAIRGSYYGELMRELEEPDDDGIRRIGSVPYDPASLVYTSWDLGHGDDTSIWFFQNVGTEVHFIDYFYDSGKPLDFYTKVVLEKDYAYAGHILPHDAKAMHLGMQRTIEEQLSVNLKNITVLERESLETGINASRNLIRKSWFDRQKCEYGIESLKQYRREFDPSKKVFKNKPLHDWTSHGADAFRYAAMGRPEGNIVWPALNYGKSGII